MTCCTSLRIDIAEFPNIPCYESLFLSIDYTRFMLVKYGNNLIPADCHSYGGLGRFPKTDVSAQNVFLLPCLQRDMIQIPIGRSLTMDELDAIKRHICTLYRKELLSYIRKNFDPKIFSTEHQFELKTRTIKQKILEPKFASYIDAILVETAPFDGESGFALVYDRRANRKTPVIGCGD